MPLALVAFGTMLLASLAILAGVWLLTRTGRPAWAVLVLVSTLILDVFLFQTGARMPLVSSLLLLPICASVGTLVGWWIEARSTLVVALFGAAVADLASTLTAAGFTRQVVADAARGGQLLSFMTVSIPYAGGTLHVIGFADLAVLAIVILALRNQGVGWWPAFLVPLAGFLMALLFSLATGWAPGLPFLTATTLTFLYFLPAPALSKTIDK